MDSLALPRHLAGQRYAMPALREVKNPKGALS